MHPAIAIERSEEYWACARPEASPNLDDTVFDIRCRSCSVALHAYAELASEDPWFDGIAAVAEDGPVTRMFQSTFNVYEAARQIHDLPALRSAS